MRFTLHSRQTAGITLMEPMIAAGILAIVASSTIMAMMGSNRFVVSQRYTSNAMALCQERIDQALTEPLNATSRPPFFPANPLPSAEPTAPTHTESVPIYTKSESGSPVLVNGTRNTWVTGYAPAASDPGFVYARVRVRVEFWLNQRWNGSAWVDGRGLENRRQGTSGAQPFSCELTTLRAVDAEGITVN